ncbi:hypothetical protein ACLBTQ_14650, partial [Pseudomonas aeruginosa]
ARCCRTNGQEWPFPFLERHIHKLMCDRYLRRGYAV